MKHNVNEIWKMIIILGIVFFIMGCSLSSNPSVKPTPTSTVTSGGSGPPLPGSNRCDGLSGELEMKVLVGPSDAVGLEPFGVGSIPFSVVSDGGANVVQGGGAISYQDVLEEEWGTYTVAITKNKNRIINSPFFNFLENHPILYQLLLRFLRL